MIVDRALLEQLMKLDADQRRAVADLMMATLDDDDDGDDLDDEDRARLHAALDRGRNDFKAGRFYTAAEVIAELEARHRAGKSE